MIHMIICTSYILCSILFCYYFSAAVETWFVRACWMNNNNLCSHFECMWWVARPILSQQKHRREMTITLINPMMIRHSLLTTAGGPAEERRRTSLPGRVTFLLFSSHDHCYEYHHVYLLLFVYIYTLTAYETAVSTPRILLLYGCANKIQQHNKTACEDTRTHCFAGRTIEFQRAACTHTHTHNNIQNKTARKGTLYTNNQ